MFDYCGISCGSSMARIYDSAIILSALLSEKQYSVVCVWRLVLSSRLNIKSFGVSYLVLFRIMYQLTLASWNYHRKSHHIYNSNMNNNSFIVNLNPFSTLQ